MSRPVDFTWARMGLADSEVECYLHSDFRAWGMSYTAIETFIVQALQSRGIKPAYVKGTHMATGSFFIIMSSLKEAYDMIEMIQETTLNGTLNCPQPITVDWSHSQATMFHHYLGHIPEKYQAWPR